MNDLGHNLVNILVGNLEELVQQSKIEKEQLTNCISQIPEELMSNSMQIYRMAIALKLHKWCFIQDTINMILKT